MKKDRVFDDKRLLGTLDGVETRFLSEALEYYDDPIPGKTKKARAALYKRIALLAASIILCAAAFPVVNYVLPRLGILIGGNAGAGSEVTIPNDLTYTEGDFTFLKPIGEVPEEFKKIVENDLFAGADYANGIVYTVSRDDDYVYVNFYDKYGESLSVVKLDRGGEYYPAVHELYPTSDGNYIMVFDSSRRSVGGNLVVIPQKFVRFSLDGRILSETVLGSDFVGSFDYFFETDSGYIFVGDCNADKVGTITTNDIALLKLDFDGNIVKYVQDGEDDHDLIYRVEQTEKGVNVYFYMHTRSDSTEPGGFKMYEFDNDLNLIAQKDIEKDDIPERNPYFYISGTPYYSYEDFFTDYDFNKSYAVEIIEYEDFVLFVSSHHTYNEYKIISFSSTKSPYLECSESVYTAYSYDGEILWRATVDSTDYEALQKRLDEIKEYQNNPITIDGDYTNVIPINPDVPIDTD